MEILKCFSELNEIVIQEEIDLSRHENILFHKLLLFMTDMVETGRSRLQEVGCVLKCSAGI